MVFDPTVPDFAENSFPKEDWTYTPYTREKEEIPSNVFEISANVDSDHAGDFITRRSRTDFIIFLNNSPIYWSSKKQGGIEMSSFGSEFIAMKQCCEYIRGLRFTGRWAGFHLW